VRLTLIETSPANRRYRVALDDGNAVEAVHYRGDTLCVSSQVGCAVGCPFCASGAGGLTRPLTFEELAGQLDAVRAEGLLVTRVTVSGVGEPLHNLHAVARFIALCRAQRIGPSVTTSGGPLERLRELLGLPHNGLTISVHAGSELIRQKLVPRAPALQALYAVLSEELPRLSRSRRKKLALAYLMVRDANDTEAELDAFIARTLPLAAWGIAVHLYAYNPVPTSSHQPVSREAYELGYARMREAGLLVRMSSQARIEANGGCGTLVALRSKRESA
jgi:23S rRNA (adenine2503-C2)-methyltransferase